MWAYVHTCAFCAKCVENSFTNSWHDGHWGSHQLSAEDTRDDISVEKKLIHLVTNFLVWLSNQLTIYFMDQFIFHHSTEGNVTVMRFTRLGDLSRVKTILRWLHTQIKFAPNFLCVDDKSNFCLNVWLIEFGCELVVFLYLSLVNQTWNSLKGKILLLSQSLSLNKLL